MERLKKLRESKNLTQKDLSDILNVDRTTYAKWEIGNSNPSLETLIKISNFFNVSTDYLLENDSKETVKTSENGIKIPVLGEVAAGFPIFADENIIDWEEIPRELTKTNEYFALKIHGNSMEPRIYNNDVVIVRKQSDVDSGDIAIILINGESGTCKKVIKHTAGITLISFNPAYEPMYFSIEDINTLPVKILGKVVELRGKL